jgi:hypothetical protein
MANNDDEPLVEPIATVVEQALKVPAAMITPTLGVVVEVLEKIAGDLIACPTSALVRQI